MTFNDLVKNIKDTEPKMFKTSYSKEWRIHGMLHRTDGPAVEYTNGDRLWYVNNKFHRTDGPAIEKTNGDKKWLINGKLHRVDGPAIERANGDNKWFIDGEELTEEEFNQWRERQKILKSNDHGIDLTF